MTSDKCFSCTLQLYTKASLILIAIMNVQVCVCWMSVLDVSKRTMFQKDCYRSMRASNRAEPAIDLLTGAATKPHLNNMYTYSNNCHTN